MRERLNVRATAVALGMAIVVGACLFWLHKWQVDRQAGALLELARTAEEHKKIDRAVALYNSYLAARPADTAARAEYALLLDRAVRDGKARGVVADLFAQVLVEDAGQTEVRKRLALHLLQSGQFVEAADHLLALKADTAQDAELAFLMGTCHQGMKEPGPAEIQYRRSLALDPKPVLRSTRLAGLLREAKTPESNAQADQVIDRMVAANPTDATAHLVRAQYRRAYNAGDPAGDLAEAVRLSPAEAEVRLTAAAVTTDPAQSRRHLEAALGNNPKDPRAYLALAELDTRAGNPAAGVAMVRRGLTAAPADTGLLLALAELQIRVPDLPAAERTLAEIDRWKRAPEHALVLRGRLLMARGQWQAARTLLEGGRASLSAAPALAALAAEADILIARCCEQANDHDAALAVYRRAKAVDTRPDAVRGTVLELARLGRTAEAVAECRQLIADPAASPETWLLFARLRTLEYLNAPEPGSAKAAELEALFKDVGQRAKTAATDLALMRADVRTADQQPTEAVRLLKDELAKRPDDVRLGAALARLLAASDVPAAWKVLDDLGPTVAAVPSWHLTRLALLPADTPPRSTDVVRAVEKRAAAAEPAERVLLLTALAESYTRWQNPAEARRYWLEVGKLQPADVSSRFRLFELAAAAGDRGQMEEAVRAVQQVEGPGGPFGEYAAALLCVTRPQDRTPERLREARQHLAAAALARPNWAIVLTTRGMLSEAENKPAEALADYLRAVELGDKRPEVVRRTVQLLCEQRRFADAEGLIRRAGTAGRADGQLDRLSAVVSLANDDTQRAVELAGAAVAPTSPNSADHLWQAGVFAAAGRKEAAVEAVRRAVAASPNDGPTRLALVRYLIRADRRADADAEIAALGTHLKGRDLALTTAQCFEEAGRAADAKAAYQTALASHPDDLEVVRQAVDYSFRSGTPTAAVPALRGVLAKQPPPPPADLAWARRMLALGLADDGRPDTFAEALGLLDRNLAAVPDSPDDLFAKARVQATRPSHRRAALTTLDRLSKSGTLPADGAFLVGQLQADTGDWAEGRRRMIDVLARGESAPARIVFLADQLVRHDELGDAEGWIDRLESSNSLPVDAMRLRVLVFAKQGRATEAVTRLRRFAAGPDGATTAQVLDRVRAAARVADEAARTGGDATGPLARLADELFAEAAAKGQPADLLAQASNHGRRGRVEAAVDACRQAEASVGPQAVAATLIGIAYATPPLTDPALDVIDRAFTAALDRVSPSAGRESMAAVMLARRGRYAAAAEAFGRAGGGLAEINNQAYMLVLAGQPADALKLLTPVFAQAGESPELLDTRGAAHLAGGRTAEAIADLERAVDQQPTVTRVLHLAAAYQKAGRKDDAAKLRPRIQQLRTEATALLPAEQRLLDELNAG